MAGYIPGHGKRKFKAGSCSPALNIIGLLQNQDRISHRIKVLILLHESIIDMYLYTNFGMQVTF
jgi:hypothetical protein